MEKKKGTFLTSLEDDVANRMRQGVHGRAICRQRPPLDLPMSQIESVAESQGLTTT